MTMTQETFTEHCIFVQAGLKALFKDVHAEADKLEYGSGGWMTYMDQADQIALAWDRLALADIVTGELRD